MILGPTVTEPFWDPPVGPVKDGRQTPDRVGFTGLGSDYRAEKVSKLGHVAYMLTRLSPLLHIIYIIFVTFWCFTFV